MRAPWTPMLSPARVAASTRCLKRAMLALLSVGCCLSCCAMSGAEENGVASVTPTDQGRQLQIQLRQPVESSWQIGELQPWQNDQDQHNIVTPVQGVPGTDRLQIPALSADNTERFDTRFRLLVDGKPVGPPQYVTELQRISRSSEPFPDAASKKGLQVQMIDDAIALGIHHATLNVNLAGLVDPGADADSLSFDHSGRRYNFHRRAVEGLDRQVRALSKAGIHVYLILLNYVHGSPRIDALMRHPDSARKPRNNISAFNVVQPDGAAWYAATVAFLADRYSGLEREFGRVVGYIVGNEVNSHAWWHAQGRAEPATVIEQYHRMLRTAHSAVRRSSATARVYVSLDHFWTGRIGDDPLEAFGGRQLLEGLAALSEAQGNFDWHVAHHPYPENLFEPRSWLDRSATDSPDTQRITFRNLDQLTDFLNRPEMTYRGQPRRVILSEQGFHSPATEDGQRLQAAGFCYAWMRVQQLEGVDAFILHRHVDHAHEGGLNLGLWTRKTDSIATPDQKKMIYDVFRTADTSDRQSTFQFALPVIGIRSWQDLPTLQQRSSPR